MIMLESKVRRMLQLLERVQEIMHLRLMRLTSKKRMKVLVKKMASRKLRRRIRTLLQLLELMRLPLLRKFLMRRFR